MKRTLWCPLALGGLALLVTAGPAEAQRRGGWGVGVGRGGVSFGYGNPGFGWGNPGFGWGNPGFGWGGNNFGYRGIGWGGNVGYAYPSYGSIGYSTPVYVDSGAAMSGGMSGYQSLYGADMGNTVRLRVFVPRPDARVWIDNNATRQMGYDRVFESPQLEPGKRYSYQVKATWMDNNGQEVTKEKTVDVTPGQMSTVRFGDDDHGHDANQPVRDQRDPNQPQRDPNQPQRDPNQPNRDPRDPTRPVTPANPPAVNPPA